MVNLEDYECDGCRADRLGIMSCGSCPSNNERIREYNRKKATQNMSYEDHVAAIIRNKGGLGFVSD